MKPKASTGILYLVATPIGNLDDISTRCRKAFESADIVACEDTRRTSKLCAHFGVRPQLLRIDAHASDRSIAACIEQIQNGATCVAVSDAGVPGVSDPGAALVEAARVQQITVVPIPGPSAVTAILSVSGFDSAEFTFCGFMPRTDTARSRWCEDIARGNRVAVAFLSPHRIAAELASIAEHLPTARLCLGRELTKMHEHIQWAKGSQVPELDAPEKGEYVIAIDPRSSRTNGGDAADDAGQEQLVQEWIRRLSARGLQGKALTEAAHEICGGRKKDIYNAVLALKDE